MRPGRGSTKSPLEKHTHKHPEGRLGESPMGNDLNFVDFCRFPSYDADLRGDVFVFVYYSGISP